MLYRPVLLIAGLGLMLLLSLIPVDRGYAQDDPWTCDEGPNDILNAAYAARDAGDLDTALALAEEAQIVCADNLSRTLEAINLLGEINKLQQPTPVPLDPPDYSDIRFGEGTPAMRLLDVYVPDDAGEPVPTIVLLHGLPGSKATLAGWALELAEHGFGAVTITWRPPAYAGIERSIGDPLCAVAWIHAHGESYGLDPERIAVWGLSASGWAAATIATLDDPALFLDDCDYTMPDGEWVDAAVVQAALLPDFEGAVDSYVNNEIISLANWFPGIAREDVPEAIAPLTLPPSEWDEAAWGPETLRIAHTYGPYWADPADPPVLFLHGTADTTVSIEAAQYYADYYASVGIEVVPVWVEGMGHEGGGGDSVLQSTAMTIYLFLVQHLAG